MPSVLGIGQAWLQVGSASMTLSCYRWATESMKPLQPRRLPVIRATLSALRAVSSGLYIESTANFEA